MSSFSNPGQPNLSISSTNEYRDNYANSVQVRVSVWDFFLVFGTLSQSAEDQVEIRNYQGIYLSPQQAKALAGVLQQNLSQYEAAFGEIQLQARAPGPIN